jgi:hypothetical protein
MSSFKSTILLALASTSLAVPYQSDNPYQFDNSHQSNNPYQSSNPDQSNKYGKCAPLPLGAGPIPYPDTPEAFLAFNIIAKAALNAVTPNGYTSTFTNELAANNAPGYAGYYALDSYDPDLCAAKCAATDGCASFNIYFERDPTLNITGDCPNPPSTTTIKCALFGGLVAIKNALNPGQWRGDFHLVIAGSNGYVNKDVQDIPGYQSDYLGFGAIEAPKNCQGIDTYMGYKQFNITPNATYNVARCAAACEETSAYNLRHALNGTEIRVCNFFNSYKLNKNGEPHVQICSMYTHAWPAQFATNKGQYREQDHYTISWSYSYQDSTNQRAAACLPGQEPTWVPSGNETAYGWNGTTTALFGNETERV